VWSVSTRDSAGSTEASEIAAALLALGAATLGESGARTMASRVRAIWPSATVAAPALPVQCTPGDNLAIHAAVAAAPAGHVLVVDVGPIAARGYWGEVLTTGAKARGVVGLVIDGGVRDLAALEAHRFPVFATMAALPGATKESPGSVGLAVSVGDVAVESGDWVVGDVDGVVIVPGGSLQQVLEAGHARAEKEAEFFDALRGGKTTVELLGLDVSPVRRVGP
jgi:4-hydroxy-4-methyl-2-oxoglutarate aldolase